MVCPLDEVANVCRWRELPDLYSHYGSRGIILMSFLQSWSQGVDVWGEQGMRKLWGAANIRLYGGGSNEQGFLDDISSVCGEMDTRQLTSSYNGGRQGHSRSYATRREPIFDVATLAALPRGRAVLMASGIDPVLIRTESVLDGPYAAEVRASLAAAVANQAETKTKGDRS
jgi:type IV secretory pathway TraG/TraD family ATPase VirD4